jgi:hypothetical protein
MRISMYSQMPSCQQARRHRLWSQKPASARLIWVLLLSLLFSSLSPSTQVVLAREEEPLAEPAGATGAGDDGVLEVGVEYVNWYPGPGDLHGTDDDALGVYNELGNGGWTKRFAYGNDWAWEQDFKATWRPGGGTENSVVDTVDLVYFSGHGGPSWDDLYGRSLWGPVFGDGGNTRDDAYLVPGDAYRAYGDGDLEWVVFSACQTVNDQSAAYWANSMYGQHLLLGFKTNMLDVNQGYWFARYIRLGRTINQAWWIATDITHPRGYVARVLANELCHYNDTATSTCADSYDTDWWYWDHEADTVAAARASQSRSLNQGLEISDLPVLEVISPLVTEGSAEALATSLGIAPDTPASLDDQSSLFSVYDGTLDLTVDKQGLFYYLDTTKFFTPTDSALNAAAVAITPEEARQAAEQYLTDRNLKPSDAVFYGVIADKLKAVELTETITPALASSGSVGATAVDVAVTVVDEQTLNYQVVYSREIEITRSNGTTATLEIEGPGSQLKVYVDTTGEVIGVMGGWRLVDQVALTSAGTDAETPISAAQVKQLYETIGDAVSIAPTTFNADKWTVDASSVTYYEGALGNDLSQLTRVYALDVTQTNTKSGTSITTRSHVPAIAEQIAPLARIQSSTGGVVIISKDQSLTLTALDASKTLADLGYHASLTFPLGKGPYTYQWTLGHTGELLGTGRTLSIQGSQFTPSSERDALPLLSIILTVTDANGKSSRTAQPLDVIGVTNGLRTYLPSVQTFK